MGLSIKNGWRDGNDRIYIYFTLEDIQEYMNNSEISFLKGMPRIMSMLSCMGER